jgi:hypothetical protein
MIRGFVAIAGVALVCSFESGALAAETCTIAYRLDVTLQVTDTDLGKGDVTVPGLRGSLVLEFPRSGDGDVVDGKVKMLHFAMYERFTIDSLVKVTTTVHHYAPTCSGVATPIWRRTSDAGFPRACAYTGNERALAVGTLSRDAGTIEWGKCKAAPTYWAKGRRSYLPSDKSKGRGCLEQMHVAGNIHCEGRLACKLGGLARGDNPQFDVWTQPLIHGPPDGKRSVAISSDLSTITTPRNREDGYQSYNMPNDSPSRTWFYWKATRDEQSKATTCP